MENCFYETYLVGQNIEATEAAIESIKEKFMSIAKVMDVIIEDVPKL